MTTSSITRSNHLRFWAVAGVIVAAAAARLIPHPPNFTPVGAMALFAGAALSNWRLAFLLPLTALVISDIFIGQMQGPGFGLHRSQLVVYGGFLLITLLGRTLQNHRRNPIRIVGTSLGASVLFFAVTNFGVWLMSGMYAHTPSELVRCFVQAIPFFGNTVTGDLLFSLAFFGGLAFLEKHILGERGVLTPRLRPIAPTPDPGTDSPPTGD